MAVPSPFIGFVLEVLGAWRPVTARRMFGGHGIYHQGLMFALEAGGQLYFKVDDESRPDFLAAGLDPFVYEARGRRVSLSYHRAPDAMLDEPDLAREWCERAWQAALRAQALKARPSGQGVKIDKTARPIRPRKA